MDTYGCLEPVDLPAMERVFEDLKANRNVRLNSGHFASLINAYGCVAKDFDKAIAVFQSLSADTFAPPLDAIIFEAVINVIVAHRRTDLIPVYVSKMNEAGVHMTAYIANFLIKGYANMGDLDQARSIFESLRDPPSGMAAPNNHAPHHPVVSPDVHIMAVVYREVRITIFFFKRF
jgi:pentatricopeptide repeat protein